MGYLVLQGGAEFGGAMAASDQRAMALAGGVHAPIHIIPAAAAPDQNHHRAGRNGAHWFRSLGARSVSVDLVIDQGSANDAGMASRLAKARIVYLLGGFPAYLARVLKGSLCWQAIRKGLAGTMVLDGTGERFELRC